jgi:hypothetical protein
LQAAQGDPNRAFDFLASGFGMGGGGGVGAGAGAGFGMGQEMMEDDYGDEVDEGSADYGGNPFEAFASNPGF